MKRKDGYYWIKWTAEIDWVIAEWSDSGGWSFCGNDESNLFFEPYAVGPMIERPSE